MKETYTISVENIDRVKKNLARLMVKAERYGIRLETEIGKPYAKEIPIRNTEHLYPGEKMRTCLMEVVDLTIDSEEIRNGDYAVVASIEHGEKGNVIWAAGDVKKEWTEISGKCDHCGRRHGVMRSFIVRNPEGEEKQVGRSCLKDYTGIDPQGIGLRNEMTEIILREDIWHYEGEYAETGKAIAIETALGLACDCIREYGYTRSTERDSNRATIAKGIEKSKKPTPEGAEKAREMIDTIGKMDSDLAYSAGLSNIHTFVVQGYCKLTQLGFIAYAPVAYNRWVERCKAKAEMAASSDYVGEIGKRMDFRIREAKILTSWDNGYGMTYLYRMLTEEGNVLIWKGSKHLGQKIDDNWIPFTAGCIKGTVKEHAERDGVRQTLITRVKVA